MIRTTLQGLHLLQLALLGLAFFIGLFAK